LDKVFVSEPAPPQLNKFTHTMFNFAQKEYAPVRKAVSDPASKASFCFGAVDAAQGRVIFSALGSDGFEDNVEGAVDASGFDHLIGLASISGE
jgi:hypothetical protein